MEKFDYDAQIRRLIENPEDIYEEWSNGIGLFKFLGDNQPYDNIGCISMIKGGKMHAEIKGKYSAEITNGIRADERIPNSSYDITIESLVAFKEWQEKFDELENA